MSGLRRLSIFLSALWLCAFLVLGALDDKVIGSLMIGSVPLGFIWGVWWVVRGFRGVEPRRARN